MKSTKEIIENKLNRGEDVLIMVVGDSITWGLNHCTPDETFCAELARNFADFFPNVSVLRYDGIVASGSKPLKCYEGPIKIADKSSQTLTIVRSGIGGNTVKKALERTGDYVGNFITGQKPDLYLIMFGINDSLIEDSNKYVTPDIYYEHLKQMYNTIKTSTPDAQIAFLTPTYNDNGTFYRSRLEPYSNKMKDLAAETKSFLIDTHSLWMSHLIVNSYNYGQRDWLSSVNGDSCHMSPKGSVETGKFIFKQLMEE